MKKIMILYRFIFVLCTGLLLSANAYSQTEFRLTGTFYFSGTTPAGITVRITDTNKSTVTDRDGSFSLIINKSDLNNDIKFSMAGYKSEIIPLKNTQASWSVSFPGFTLKLQIKEIEEIRYDSDGDGVPDNMDKCPAEPGIVSNDGCPVVLQNQGYAYKWNYTNTSSLVVAYQKEEVKRTLRSILIADLFTEKKIIPTKDAIEIIESLNPQLDNIDNISGGTVIEMPAIPPTSEERDYELERNFRDQNSVINYYNDLFIEKCKYFSILLVSSGIEKKYPEVYKKLKPVNEFMNKEAGKPNPNFITYEIELLNAEIQGFTDYLEEKIKAQAVDAIEVSYINDFEKTVTKIINEHYGNDEEPGNKALGGPLYSEDQNSDELIVTPPPAVQLRVAFYVFKQGNKAPMNSYDIYCITKRENTRLQNNEITLAYLESLGRKIPYPASVTAKMVNISFDWVILAVNTKTYSPVITWGILSDDKIVKKSVNPEAKEPYAFLLSVKN